MIYKIRHFLSELKNKVSERNACRRVFTYDFVRFVKTRESGFDAEWLRTRITKRAHVLEKGFTMPAPRPGFGVANMNMLVKDILKWVEITKTVPDWVDEIIGGLFEYEAFHEHLNYKLSDDVASSIKQLHRLFPNTKAISQRKMTRDQFFSEVNSPFEIFALSRYSIRNLLPGVELATLHKAISIALCAPSACNRQPWRVYVVADHKKVQDCLALQNGNRGFGHLVDKLIVVSVDLRTIWLPERHDIYLNAGLFLMNLCYALHHHKIGACILNWSPNNTPDGLRFPNDEALRKILSVPYQEDIVAMVACGNVPDTVIVANSRRRSFDEVVTFV